MNYIFGERADGIAVIRQSEKFLRRRWLERLSTEESDVVIEEYNDFNESFGVIDVSDSY